MSNPVSRYPLQWPDGWKRLASHQRKEATFKRAGKDLSVADGVARVQAEMERLGVHEADMIVSTNVRTRLDGFPRSGEPKPSDPGVCVYWQKSSKEPMRCMAVDRYDEVADNLAAIAATLEAMRAIERHGGAAILDRAFTGFAALPAPAPTTWRQVLALQGLNRPITKEDIEGAHRRLRSQYHPDRGGDVERMAQLNVARDQALKEIQS